MDPCKQTNKHHQTNLLQITGPLELLAPCNDTQKDVSWVERESWQSFNPMLPVAYYIFLRTFHFSVLSALPFPQQQVMDWRAPHPGVIQSELSRTMGPSSNAPLAELQQQYWHQIVHRDAAIAAIENMSQDTHLKQVRKTGLSNNRQQHAIGCEYLHIDKEGSQLTIYYTAGVRRQLRDQFTAAPNGKPPWSTKAFVHTVSAMEHHDVVSSGIFAHEFHEKGPWEWTKQALMTLEEATESYIVEVIAKASC